MRKLGHRAIGYGNGQCKGGGKAGGKRKFVISDLPLRG